MFDVVHIVLQFAGRIAASLKGGAARLHALLHDHTAEGSGGAHQNHPQISPSYVMVPCVAALGHATIMTTVGVCSVVRVQGCQCYLLCMHNVGLHSRTVNQSD